MIKCMPIVTAIGEDKIAFHVVIMETGLNIDVPHTMYGGGQGNTGEKIGEASLVLHDCSETWGHTDTEVLYLDGHRYDGKDFNSETGENVIVACNEAAKAIWG